MLSPFVDVLPLKVIQVPSMSAGGLRRYRRQWDQCVTHTVQTHLSAVNHPVLGSDLVGASRHRIRFSV